ncbi:hypothetical protein OAC51_09295, partial [Flavobacteriaceae bacterium]|nr:hypothetical protein [Flavobacteriaceae bacterium]
EAVLNNSSKEEKDRLIQMTLIKKPKGSEVNQLLNSIIHRSFRTPIIENQRTGIRMNVLRRENVPSDRIALIKK